MAQPNPKDKWPWAYPAAIYSEVTKMTRIKTLSERLYLVNSISVDFNHNVLQHGGLFNPPPKDLRFEVCRRHVSNLPPFSSDFRDWMREYEGEVLLHSQLPVWRFAKEEEKIWNKFFGKCGSDKD